MGDDKEHLLLLGRREGHHAPLPEERDGGGEPGELDAHRRQTQQVVGGGGEVVAELQVDGLPEELEGEFAGPRGVGGSAEGAGEDGRGQGELGEPGVEVGGV